MRKVIVMGSINVDIVMKTLRFPKIGETILGDNVQYFMGGKGSNQAIAAARAGGEVIMFANVGADAFGEKALRVLQAEKINTDHISIQESGSTGVASIFCINADNAIVVLPGANASYSEVKDIQKNVAEEDVFLTQLEIPLETVKEGLKLAKEKGALTILNPAPFDKRILEFVELIDIITPNESEFEGMIGHSINEPELEFEMAEWEEKNRTRLIVTRGADGVSYIEKGKAVTIPAMHVNVVDTTGAGDTFNGVLAALLAEKMKWEDAVRMASRCASIATTEMGAQTGIPFRDQYGELHI